MDFFREAERILFLFDPMAVPRIIAAVLENGWREVGGFVEVPACLHQWLPKDACRIDPR